MIFHLALTTDWAAAQRAGEYTVSTRGRDLGDVGFVHCSTAAQWPVVRSRFYADLPDAELVLLTIDPARLGTEVRFEPGEPGSNDLFPHVYGPVPVRAVVEAAILSE